MARGKSVIQVVITGEARGLRRATDAAGSALLGFAAIGAKVISIAGSLASALGIASVKAFADFDAAMTKSLAIMGDVSQTLEQDMVEAAREVAKTTTFTAEQAAESYFFLASAGLDAAQSIQALPQVAQFAQAGMFDMALATDLLTDAQSALGLTIRDDTTKNMQNMARVSDVLVRANTLANATVQQFAESLTNKAGAALSVANKSIEEGVAVLAAFADQGVKGAEAGERLSVFLRDVARAGAANADEFAKFNVQVFDATGNLRNAADIVEEFEDLFGGMSDAQKAATLDTLGLTRSVADNIKVLAGTSDAIRRYERELREAGGTTEQVANKQLQTFSAQMQLVRSGLTDALLTIGGSFQPAMETFAAFLRNRVVVIVGEWAERLAEIAPVINDWIIGALGSLNRAISDNESIIRMIADTAMMWWGVFKSDLLPILQDVWRFLSGPLLDVFMAFKEFIREEVVPRVRDIVEVAGDLIEKFVNWAEIVAPDVIKSFKDIAEPVVDIYDNLSEIVGDVVKLGQAFAGANPPGGLFARILDSVTTDLVIIGEFIRDVTSGINKFTDGLNRLAESSGFRALERLMSFADKGLPFLPTVENLDRGLRELGSFVKEGLLPSPLRFTTPAERAPGFFDRQEFLLPQSAPARGGGGNVNVTVTSADPNAVVQAIKQYTRYNGPLGTIIPI